MKIKRFTDFILENQYYNPINEAEIVPGVPYNTGYEMTDKDTNKMSVYATPSKPTSIHFRKNKGETVILEFYPEGTPLNIDAARKTVYASVHTTKDSDDKTHHTTVTKVEDFGANKSGQLYNASNSIDLLADFMDRSGISADATAGANLAKVITNLLLNPKYNTGVTESFKKFATKIGGEISIKAFLPRMSQAFISSKQSAGMQSFIEEWPKSYAALKPPKKA